MALFQTWSDANKQTDSGLLSTYVSELDAPMIGADGWYWYRLERHRTKTYRYVGMTEAAAKACAAAKYQQYMRPFYEWKYENGIWKPWSHSDGQWVFVPASEDRYYVPCADVSADHDEGQMWSVTVTVDETCVAYMRYEAGDAATGNVATMETVISTLCNTGDWEYDE